MGITLDIYKRKIKRIIKEVLNKNLDLVEIFDSPPLKTDFKFEEDPEEIFTKFEDLKNNKIKTIFHKMNNNVYMLDFTMNGTSYKDSKVDYSLKDYTTLLATVAKATSQFIDKYEPNALRIDGADSFEKEFKGKKGQKINIYDYFINNMKYKVNYSIQYKANGNFDLIKNK
tara:strand:- start:188 stop:700 length:513 start_codon:yes stop_codon:yes gene_type:complete